MQAICSIVSELPWTRDSKIAAISCGGTLIAGLIAFFAWRFPGLWHKKTGAPEITVPPAPAKRIGANLRGDSEPTPADIGEAVGKALLSMRQATRDAYSQIPIDWKVNVNGMTRLSEVVRLDPDQTENDFIIHCKYVGSSPQLLFVSFVADLNQQPLLRTIKQDQLVRIRGKIIKVSLIGIEVNVDEIVAFSDHAD